MDENKLEELWKRTYEYIKTNDVTFLGGKRKKSKQKGGNKIKEVAFAVYDAFIATLLIIVVLLKIGENPSYEINIDNLIQHPEEVINLAVAPEMKQALVLVKNAKPMIQNKDMPSNQEMFLILRNALQGIGMKELNRALLTMLPLSKQDKAGYKTFETMRQARQMAEYAKSLRDAALQLDIGEISDFYPIEESKQNNMLSSGVVGPKILSLFEALPKGTGAKTMKQRIKDADNRIISPKRFSFDEVYDEQLTNSFENPMKTIEKEDDNEIVGMDPSKVRDDINGGRRRKKRKTNKRKRKTQKRRGRKTRRYYY